jgi:hypothetical protein
MIKLQSVRTLEYAPAANNVAQILAGLSEALFCAKHATTFNERDKDTMRQLVGIYMIVAAVGTLGVAACESSSMPESSNATLGGSGGRASAAGTGGKSTSNGGTTANGGATNTVGPVCQVGKAFSCPAVDGSKLLSSLQAVDHAAFCDCRASYSGGYGGPMCSCSDGSTSGVSAPSSQAACVSVPAAPSGCPLTVSQYAACVNAMWANPCDNASIAAGLADPNCQIVMSQACAN